MIDVATQAGCKAQFLFTDDIGQGGGQFYDLELMRVDHCFKLYPWEWMIAEKFGPTISNARCKWVEPPWRALLSNKAMLAKLWEKFEGHELLLPAFIQKPKDAGSYVRKPIYGREGANILLPGDEETPGDYDKTGWVYQKFCPLPAFDGWKPMIGSWVIGDQPAGIGIRENTSLVTSNMSRFTPHWFE